VSALVRRASQSLLAARGVRHGDRIALLSENRLEVLELFLAAARLGAIVACQNWRLAAPELAHCLLYTSGTTRAQLAGYKQPKGIYFIPLEAFPRSASGKVQRHQLEASLPAERGGSPKGP
jgi:acyl-CoA synthetase (AMP-forming)/AMP-acid ligase II